MVILVKIKGSELRQKTKKLQIKDPVPSFEPRDINKVHLSIRSATPQTGISSFTHVEYTSHCQVIHISPTLIRLLETKSYIRRPLPWQICLCYPTSWVTTRVPRFLYPQSGFKAANRRLEDSEADQITLSYPVSLVIGGMLDITAFIPHKWKWSDDTMPGEARKGWCYEMTNELTSIKSYMGVIKDCRRAGDPDGCGETRDGLQSFDMVIRCVTAWYFSLTSTISNWDSSLQVWGL